MTHSVAKSKVNDLLSELQTSIVSTEKLSDFEFAKYKREASRLPSYEEATLIEVLAYCAAHKLEEAKAKAVSAIRQYSNDSSITSNIIWAMLIIGKPTVAYEAIKRMPLESADEYDVENIISTNNLFNDFGIDARLNEWLIRTQQNDLLSRKQKSTEARQIIMQDIEAKFDVASSTINELSVMAAKIIEEHESVVLNHTLLAIPPESSKATLTVYVECEPEKIFDLNWDLSGALVDAELDEVRCITHFEILGDNVPTFVERIKNAG